MNKQKVVYTDSIFPTLEVERSVMDPLGVELIDARCKTVEDVIAASRGAVALVNTALKQIGEAVFSSCPTIRLVVRTGVGVDTIDLLAATRYGVLVCNVPDFCLDEVSDHTVGLLLSIYRKIVLANSRVKKGEFSYYTYVKPINRLRNQTVGFIGFGRIGRLVANKLSPFGVHMLFYDPFIKEEYIEGCKKASLEETLQKSDFLCVHTPETPETHHLLNRERLCLMKPSAYIINTARGGIIDTSALIQILKDGKLAGAALDVVEGEPNITPDNPLCQMENVILTPHDAWYSEDSIQELRIKTAMEVARFIKGETLRNLVNREVLDKISRSRLSSKKESAS